jgi:hypothetical protein
MPRTGLSPELKLPTAMPATFPRKRFVNAFTSRFRGNACLPPGSDGTSGHAACRTSTTPEKGASGTPVPMGAC